MNGGVGVVVVINSIHIGWGMLAVAVRFSERVRRVEGVEWVGILNKTLDKEVYYSHL